MAKKEKVEVAPKPPAGLKLHQQREITRCISERESSLLRHFDQGTKDADLPDTLDRTFTGRWQKGEFVEATGLSTWPRKLRKLYDVAQKCEETLQEAITTHNEEVLEVRYNHSRKAAKVRNHIKDIMSNLRTRVILNGMGDMGVEFLDSLPTPDTMAEFAKEVGLAYDAAPVRAAIEMDD